MIPFASILGFLAFLNASDPAPGPNQSRADSRNLDCERLTAAVAHQRYPGTIAPPASRGEVGNRTAFVCRERLVRPGVRAPGDEAILSSLDGLTVGLAEAAVSLRPDLAHHTWLVEAYDPSGPVSAKITFATKNALVGRGVAVSDRAPMLAAGDVAVLTSLPPDRAYPAACRRYADTGSLGAGDALLAVVRRDPRETILHAGLCVGGVWTWLR